ncbi:hypothetical protein BGW42_005138 [Actinomortierella wolfii]|nr:hypothetical protein BGW42_005138 [Actinomortierella wolfii]
MMHESDYQHPSMMDAEQLMAFKHTKRTFGYEPTLPGATYGNKRLHADGGASSSSSSDEEECGPVPHNRGHKLKKRPNGVTGGTRLLIRDPAQMLLEEQQHVLTQQQQLQQQQQYHHQHHPHHLPDGPLPPTYAPIMGTGVTGRHHNKKPITAKLLTSLSSQKREAIVLSSQRHPYLRHSSTTTRPSRADTSLYGPGGYYDTQSNPHSLHHPHHGHAHTHSTDMAFDPAVAPAVGVPGTAAAAAAAVAAAGGDDDDDEEDPYADIRIPELLAPLEHSTDILTRAPLRRIFESPELQIMAVHGMAMIEREKTMNKAMARLAMVLQGDDPFCADLGYGYGEGCSSAPMGQPEQPHLVQQNKEWKRKGEDREAVQETLALLMENIHCSNQYMELLSRSRDAVNHVLRQKHELIKKLRERREKERKLRAKQQQHQQLQQLQHASSGAAGQSGSGHAGKSERGGGSSSHANGTGASHGGHVGEVGGSGGVGGSGRDHHYGYQGR